MNNQLFRQKSIDRVSSPDQLNDYMHVTNPGVFLVLVGAILLLLGICAWGIFGHLDTTVNGVAVVREGDAVCYLPENSLGELAVGDVIALENTTATVAAIAQKPSRLTADVDEYTLHLGGFEAGDWVMELTLQTDAREGEYPVTVITGSVLPISLILN